MKTIIRLSLIFAFLLLINFGFANVWLDENFDDGIAFDDVDTYHYEALTNPVSITGTGLLTTSRSFDGANSYQIGNGQSVYVTEPYSKQTNGPFQYFQFAVSVGAIPSAGDMGIFRWNWDFDGNGVTDWSYYVKFVSTGSAVNIVAGEDVNGSTSATIGTIFDTNTWKYITCQMQKNLSAADGDDSRTGQIDLPQGMRFYCSNGTPGLYVAGPGTAVLTSKAKDWTFNVTSGPIYIDNMYWESAMTFAESIGNSNLRPLDLGIPAYATDWKLYE